MRNLNLANVNITGTGVSTILGVVAGENRGTISNVHVLSGTVNGGSLTGVIAGGLVGQNKGLIENSSSAANVSVGDANSLSAMNMAGAGRHQHGDHQGSSASGSVSGGAFSRSANGLFNFGTGRRGVVRHRPSSAGINVALGGLVGSIRPSSPPPAREP